MNVYTWFTYSTCVYLRKTFEFHRNTLGKSLRLFENARPRQRGTPFHQFENDEGSGVFASGNRYIVNLGHIIQYSSGEDTFSGQEISTCDHFKFKCWWAARARKGPP